MSFWIHGSSTSHSDLSSDIAAILAGESVDAAVLNAAGTAYTVGDILTVAGGTANIAATIEVITITGGGGTGPVGTFRIYNSGSYSVNPSITANAVTGGTGSSCTIDLTMAVTGWTVDRNTAMEVTTVDSVAAAGTGYAVGDTITLTGGDADPFCILTVSTISGGGGTGPVTGVTITDAGYYDAQASDPVAQGSTSGAGTGATFNLSYGGEQQVIAHGNGAGSDAIYVGWRTFHDTPGDYFNWECHGLTGYSASLALPEQPGTNQGDHLAGSPQDEGAYLILQNTTFNWWLNLNSYRIVLTADIGAAYFHTYMGWGNRFGTSTEYPYPMYISCPSELHDRNEGTAVKFSSITDPWNGGASSNAVGTVVRDPAGTWLQCVNRRGSSPYDDCCIVPTQKPQIATGVPSAPEDRFMSINQPFSDLVYSVSSGSGGATTAQLRPTGDNDDYVMFPCYVVESVPAAAILIEIDECKWMYAFGGPGSEDRFIESTGQAWRIFANGNRTDPYAYIAIKEAS